MARRSGQTALVQIRLHSSGTQAKAPALVSTWPKPGKGQVRPGHRKFVGGKLIQHAAPGFGGDGAVNVKGQPRLGVAELQAARAVMSPRISNWALPDATF